MTFTEWVSKVCLQNIYYMVNSGKLVQFLSHFDDNMHAYIYRAISYTCIAYIYCTGMFLFPETETKHGSVYKGEPRGVCDCLSHVIHQFLGDISIVTERWIVEAWESSGAARSRYRQLSNARHSRQKYTVAPARSADAGTRSARGEREALVSDSM